MYKVNNEGTVDGRITPAGHRAIRIVVSDAAITNAKRNYSPSALAANATIAEICRYMQERQKQGVSDFQIKAELGLVGPKTSTPANMHRQLMVDLIEAVFGDGPITPNIAAIITQALEKKNNDPMQKGVFKWKPRNSQ